MEEKMKYFIAFAIAVAFLFCHVYDLKAQWIKTNGPCGSSGVINSIAIDKRYLSFHRQR
jgi:hypothetical protein